MGTTIHKQSSPIRVLEVIRQGKIGGGESHLLDLIRGFDKSKVYPIVLSFTGGQMVQQLSAAGIPCHTLLTERPFDIRIIKQIKQLIVDENIDIIHAHGSRAASNILIPAHMLHLPVVYTVHGWSFHKDDQSALTYYLRALVEKIICQACKQVICVSQCNYDTGRRVLSLRQAEVIDNGVDLDRFNPSLPFPDVRKELNISKDDFIVAFIGRITIQKDPITFVKSIQIAHAQNPAIKGLIVGEGDMKEEVVRYIQENGLQKLFYLSDFRLDIPDILQAIQVFSLPSLWEGLSIALLEAMAMKKAIVATPTDGTKELISASSGKIVPFKNPDALAASYLEYFDQPETRHLYGNNAHTSVALKYNSRTVSDKVSRIYNTLYYKYKKQAL